MLYNVTCEWAMTVTVATIHVIFFPTYLKYVIVIIIIVVVVLYSLELVELHIIISYTVRPGCIIAYLFVLVQTLTYLLYIYLSDTQL